MVNDGKVPSPLQPISCCLAFACSALSRGPNTLSEKKRRRKRRGVRRNWPPPNPCSLSRPVRLVRVATWNVQRWPRRALRPCSTRPLLPFSPPRRRGRWRGGSARAASTAAWSRDDATTAGRPADDCQPTKRTRSGGDWRRCTKEKKKKKKEKPRTRKLELFLTCCASLKAATLFTPSCARMQFITKGAQSPSQPLHRKEGERERETFFASQVLSFF